MYKKKLTDPDSVPDPTQQSLSGSDPAPSLDSAAASDPDPASDPVLDLPLSCVMTKK